MTTETDCPVCYSEFWFTCPRCKQAMCKQCIHSIEKTTRSCPMCRLPLINVSGDIIEDVLRSAFDDLSFPIVNEDRFDRQPLLTLEIPARNMNILWYIEAIAEEHRKKGRVENIINLVVLYSEALFADKINMWFPTRSLKDKQYAHSAYKYLKQNIASALMECLVDTDKIKPCERYLELESDLKHRVRRVVDFYMELQEKYNNITFNKEAYIAAVMFTEHTQLYPYKAKILSAKGPDTIRRKRKRRPKLGRLSGVRQR